MGLLLSVAAKRFIMPKMDKRIASFSGGRSSAMMCAELLRQGGKLDGIVFANTGMESPQTYDFIAALDKAIFAPAGVGVEVVEFAYDANNKKYARQIPLADCDRDGVVFWELINRRKRIPDFRSRSCTAELKVQTMSRHLSATKRAGAIKLLGIRADEPRRIARIRASNDIYEARANTGKKALAYTDYAMLPLAEQNVKRADVVAYWQQHKAALGLPLAL